MAGIGCCLGGALIFLIMSIFHFMGKGKCMIAGYNTLSEEEQKQYDEKKVLRVSAVMDLICSAGFCIVAYAIYQAAPCGKAQSRWYLAVAIVMVIEVTADLAARRYIARKAKIAN